MIDRKPVHGLPLMYHLVQHGMLDLGPCVAGDMPAAQRDLGSHSGPAVDRELSQAPLHSTGEPNRDFGKQTTEVTLVQRAVQGLEPVNQPQVARPRPLLPQPQLRRRYVGVNREIEELSFCSPPQCTGYARIQKPDDGLQDVIWREAVPSMDTKGAPAEAEHHGLIRMGQYPLNISETEPA